MPRECTHCPPGGEAQSHGKSGMDASRHPSQGRPSPNPHARNDVVLFRPTGLRPQALCQHFDGAHGASWEVRTPTRSLPARSGRRRSPKNGLRMVHGASWREPSPRDRFGRLRATRSAGGVSRQGAKARSVSWNEVSRRHDVTKRLHEGPQGVTGHPPRLPGPPRPSRGGSHSGSTPSAMHPGVVGVWDGEVGDRSRSAGPRSQRWEHRPLRDAPPREARRTVRLPRGGEGGTVGP